MRLLFTSSSKVRVVRDGKTFVDDCPDCGRRARFDEVELTQGYGVFWVDVVSDSERAFRCSQCGETFDLKDQEGAAAAPTREAAIAKAAAAKVAAAKAEAAKADAERTREAKATQIEDELADLKRRLGR